MTAPKYIPGLFNQTNHIYILVKWLAEDKIQASMPIVMVWNKIKDSMFKAPEVYTRLVNKCIAPHDTREDVIKYQIDKVGHPSTFRTHILIYHSKALPLSSCYIEKTIRPGYAKETLKLIDFHGGGVNAIITMIETIEAQKDEENTEELIENANLKTAYWKTLVKILPPVQAAELMSKKAPKHKTI
jgi:hypothetical protein